MRGLLSRAANIHAVRRLMRAAVSSVASAHCASWRLHRGVLKLEDGSGIPQGRELVIGVLLAWCLPFAKLSAFVLPSCPSGRARVVGYTLRLVVLVYTRMYIVHASRYIALKAFPLTNSGSSE